MRYWLHLAKRFVGSLRGGPPPDDGWALAQLLPGEQALWRRMPPEDRRHAIGVARTVGSHDRAVTAAALLHDVGKIESGLGTFGRAAATVAGMMTRRWHGRVGAYLRHDELGAQLLEAAGSEPLTVAWARDHHRPPAAWTVAPDIGRALKAADDD